MKIVEWFCDPFYLQDLAQMEKSFSDQLQMNRKRAHEKELRLRLGGAAIFDSSDDTILQGRLSECAMYMKELGAIVTKTSTQCVQLDVPKDCWTRSERRKRLRAEDIGARQEILQCVIEVIENQIRIRLADRDDEIESECGGLIRHLRQHLLTKKK